MATPRLGSAPHENISPSLIVLCIRQQPCASVKCDGVLILIFMDCGERVRAVGGGVRQQNKLPLIPTEGKVQINSYSHFNAFMLMGGWGRRAGWLLGAEGLRLIPTPELNGARRGGFEPRPLFTDANALFLLKVKRL